jgi:hypothetical protein
MERIIKIFMLIIVLLIFAIPVMWLWNGILTEVFPSIHQITFTQAVGLQILTNILFKSSPYSSHNQKL